LTAGHACDFQRDDPARNHVQPRQGDSLTGHNSAYVLVVDDDRAIRDALEEILTDEGYTVRVAADGREGLEICGAAPRPDVILLDLTMPVMDGYEFSLRKQENPALAAIPVCVMTAAGPSSPVPNTAAVVLRKPLDLDELIAVITRLHEGGAAAPAATIRIMRGRPQIP
jgi:CheY-like chemotaxis protein